MLAAKQPPKFNNVQRTLGNPTAFSHNHACALLFALSNTQVLGVGGFNSWRYNQPSLYFFDVGSNPAQPKFIKSVTPEKGAVADDLIRLPNGGFLVSLMGNK